MTHREAAATAFRELGASETDIEEMLSSSDSKMKENFGEAALAQTQKTLVLEPGQTERDYIERFKHHMLAVRALNKVMPGFAQALADKVLNDIQCTVRKN